MNASELIPALRQATPDDAAAMLDKLDAEALKPLYREVCGPKRVGATVKAEDMRKRILEVNFAVERLKPQPVSLGDTITDDGSGEEVTITKEFQARIMAIEYRQAQAEFSIERGMLDTCLAVKEFKDERGYLLHGFRSFKAYCDAGQLKVTGQTRSRIWAYRQITMIEKLGEKVVSRVKHISQNKLLKLTSILSESGMEETMARLQEEGILRYTAEDGAERTLALPETPEEAQGWVDFIDTTETRSRRAIREASDAKDELALERESIGSERDAFNERIAELQGELDEALGRSDEIAEAIAAKDVADLTTEDTANMHGELRRTLADRKRIGSEISDLRGRLEGLEERIAEHSKASMDEGSLDKVRATCTKFTALIDKGVKQISPLLPYAADLHDLPRQAAIETVQSAINGLQIIADRFEGVGE